MSGPCEGKRVKHLCAEFEDSVQEILFKPVCGLSNVQDFFQDWDFLPACLLFIFLLRPYSKNPVPTRFVLHSVLSV